MIPKKMFPLGGVQIYHVNDKETEVDGSQFEFKFTFHNDLIPQKMLKQITISLYDYFQ